MMQYYFVKTDLFGIRGGRVERFSAQKAAQHLSEQPKCLELFDAKKHAEEVGAEAAIAHELAKTKHARDLAELAKNPRVRKARRAAQA